MARSVALVLAQLALAAGTGLPGERLPKLRKLLESEPHPIRILETHSGLTGLIAETAEVDGSAFHGMWSSSLTSSALRGKPDIETVDTTARLAVVTETLSVTTKPMICTHAWPRTLHVAPRSVPASCPPL